MKKQMQSAQRVERKKKRENGVNMGKLSTRNKQRS